MKNFKYTKWSTSDKGGCYNMLGSFNESLGIALSKYGKEVLGGNISTLDDTDFFIGFNVCGYDNWQKICDFGFKNIIWTVDSIFSQNFDAYKDIINNKNFILFDVASTDKFPTAHYMPQCKNIYYMPLATDLDLWRYEEVNRNNDIVFFSSIIDIEEKENYIKERYPNELYRIILEMKELALKNPDISFWELYTTAKDVYGLELEKQVYHDIFYNFSTLCQAEQRIRMIKALKKFNVKVYGNELWSKYIEGNVEYCGCANIHDSIEIMKRSKISLHINPYQLKRSMHDRFLNASALKTFTLCGKESYLEKEFENAFGFFNTVDYGDLPDLAEYYLKNDDERNEMVNRAYDIVAQNHTWDNRAQTLLQILNI